MTDAWQPQVNGVVTTLVELVQSLRAGGDEVIVIEPGQFRTRPCPGYPGIDLAVRPGAILRGLLERVQPDAVHIATEGPLGWAARRHCLRRGWAFTTAFHTKFPEILHAAVRLPLPLGYAFFRHFHRPSSGVMVPTRGVANGLAQRGFRNLREWTHGVDMRLFVHLTAARLRIAGAHRAAAAPVRGPRVVREEHPGLSSIVGLNRKLLVFPLNQVPEMARGKGVRLQKYKEGGMVDPEDLHARRRPHLEGFPSDRTWTVSQADLFEWIGNRADAGKLPPKGFPKTNKFGPMLSVWPR